MGWKGSKMMLEELKETGGSAADIAQVQEAYNTSIREWIEVVKKQSELWAIPPQGKKLQELVSFLPHQETANKNSR